LTAAAGDCAGLTVHPFSGLRVRRAASILLGLHQKAFADMPVTAWQHVRQVRPAKIYLAEG
jgi:hypothetical protein